MQGKLNDVTNYLEAKADPNTKDNNDWTPLVRNKSTVTPSIKFKLQIKKDFLKYAQI